MYYKSLFLVFSSDLVIKQDCWFNWRNLCRCNGFFQCL